MRVVAARCGVVRATTAHRPTRGAASHPPRPPARGPRASRRSVPEPDSTGAAAGRRRPAAARGGLVVARADGSGRGPQESAKQQRKDDQRIVLGGAIALTLLVLLLLRLATGGDAFQEADAWDLGADGAAFGTGDAISGLLLAIAFWYCSPYQLLVLFFGFIETERPSDWVLQRLGRAAGLDVDAVDYVVPAALTTAAAVFFGACGLGVAWASEALLGDATWAFSAGLGACMAAGMYELGRPKRLSVEEAQAKEAQWAEFKRFADERLERRGRCHETEVVKALQRALPKYREGGRLDSTSLRDLIRNWAPEAERSSQGFYKGVSVRAAGAPPAVGAGAGAAGPATASLTESTDQY